MSDPFNQAKSIFLAAIEEHPPEQWPAFLETACAGDDRLRAEVEMLLQARLEIGSFHEGPQPTLSDTVDAPISECPGTVIGPYKLLEQIGEGGFGVVFMAEQTQPVCRKVALKILKPGMDTRQVIARFEAERQALAIMDHPNIARVFDGGAAPSGRPYFVMELVRGVPITDFCDRNQFTPRQRLELFMSLCQAVQHAHQKGIIHRDLKPSNVLVTLHDIMPVVKVIDFGVAKALAQKMTDQTLFTGFAQMIGTPSYMSPEQAGQSGLDIDTRSDIYSLGVLLYELLTGTTPFDREQLKEMGYDEIRRVICEEEPPRPSTRLSTLDRQTASTIAAQRGTDVQRLNRLVRGELDWIVMKALEKDRSRRYETANGLARDVQRYLADEPVQACPPSAGYRLRKFTRRHKTGLGTLAGVVLLLLLGIAGLAQSNIRIRRAQKEAEEALADTQAFSDFLVKDLLSVARPGGDRGGLGINVTVKQALDASVPKMAERFEGRPRAEALARHNIGVTYRLLGELAKAEEQLRRALELRRSVLGPGHQETLTTANSLAVSLSFQGKYEESLPLHEEIFRLRKQHLGPTHRDTLNSMSNLGSVYRKTKRLQQAVPLLEEAHRLQVEHLGPTHHDTLNTVNSLATAYQDADRLDEALVLFEENYRTWKELYGPTNLRTLIGLNNLAVIYRHAGRFPEGLALQEEATRLQKEHLGPTHNFTLISMSNLAKTYRVSCRWEEALPLFEETLRLSRKHLGPKHSNTIYTLSDLAWLLASTTDPRLCDPERALKLAAEGAKLAPDQPDFQRTQGAARYRQGDWKGAVADLEEAIRRRTPKDQSEPASAYLFLAMAHWQLGHTEQAYRNYQQAVQWMEQDKKHSRDEELHCFRAEAEKLLKIDERESSSK